MPFNILHPTETNLHRFTLAIKQLGEGRSNAVGSVTLVANAATTVVPAINCGSGSTVLLFPETANAAAEYGAGTLRIGNVGNGSFVITHINNAQNNRTFRFACFG
jgi:hypothetical protein